MLKNWPFNAILAFLACALVFSFADVEKSSSASGNLDPELLPEADKKELPKALIIPVEGMVKPLLFTTLKRRTEEAVKNGVTLIVYKVKSDGGHLGAAMDMSNYVFQLDDKIRTIAFVDEKAYSAAALFSLACDDLYMKAHSAIGDCEPIIMSSDGYKTMGEKVQSPLRERFRSFAKKNGYPVLLAESMVKSELEVYRMKKKGDSGTILMRKDDYDILSDEKKALYTDLKIVSHKGELLTMSTDEAIDLGFSDGTYPSAEDLTKALGFETKLEIKDINETEKVINSLDEIAPILLVIAIFCLYLEFKTPGLGLFGSLSAVSFAIFFIGKFYAGQAHYMEVILFCLGMALLALEVFVFPGFGLAGFAGFILLFISLTLAMQNFDIPESEVQWDILVDNLTTVCLSFLIASLMFGGLLFILPRLKITLFPGLVHDKQNLDAPSDHIEPGIDEIDLMGKEGIALTPLMPGGKVDIEGKTYQVAARDGWIDKNSPIVVTSQEGNQIIVTNHQQNTINHEG